MRETVLKVALAGLLHDIGKIAEYAMETEVDQDYLDRNAILFQPVFRGRYTHRHATYTSAFIEWLEKSLPEELNRAQWGLEDTFVKLAAGHHRPETALQWIIAEADRLSAGWDRLTFEKEYNSAIDWRDAPKTRLLSLFERLGFHEKMNRDDFKYVYPLREISPENIFPVEKDGALPKTDEEAKSDYKRLFREFTSAIEKLAHRKENIYLWFDHFESLLGIYLSFVPQARAGMTIPDVSLYDHSRMVAAISSALFLYHTETDSYNVESIKDEKPKKFLFVGGDFYGIQNFIFSEGEAAKYRAKMLRGRSFAISLYCELAADLILRRIGLPSTSMLIMAGGKFILLLPNTESVKNELAKAEEKINRWLLRISLGESCLGISHLESAPEELTRVRFSDLWEELKDRIWLKKFSRFSLFEHGGAVKGYLERFRPLNPPLCPYCGKRPSSERAEKYREKDDRSMCDICRDHIYLGSGITRSDLRVAITSKNADIREVKLLDPIFDEYQVTFTKGSLNDLARDGSLYKYWDVNVDPTQPISKTVTVRFIAGYVPTYREEDMHDKRILSRIKSGEKEDEGIEVGKIKTFEHIAAKALVIDENDKEQGVAALGVLKADVDHLGKLMSCGLSEEEISITRMAALSRQFNLFFTLCLPYLLKNDRRFHDIYTVFAGGDDLFFVGPWNRIIDFASLLNERFISYVCHNPEIHLSAGISLQKPNTPIQRVVDDVEDALSKSKDNGRNSITVFGSTAKWHEFYELMKMKSTLFDWFNRKIVNSAMLFRLNHFIGMVEKERVVCSKGGVRIEDMECLKWRAFFTYVTERNVGSVIKDESVRKEVRNEFLKVAEWLEKYREKLRIPLWGLIYDVRRGGRL
ncbi:MAG: type III-A CRISPR-associated protein Cas10/Csm1 [Syntrophales bacterium]|nr:type III-A CRISPR-associated protein Cas10/Csm1 [Syntrophales bacterium]